MVNGYIISELISLYDEHIHFSLSLSLSLSFSLSWCCYRKEIAQRTTAGKSTVPHSLFKHTPWHRILKNPTVAQPIRNFQLRPKYNISWNSIQIFWYPREFSVSSPGSERCYSVISWVLSVSPGKQ